MFWYTTDLYTQNEEIYAIYRENLQKKMNTQYMYYTPLMQLWILMKNTLYYRDKD